MRTKSYQRMGVLAGLLLFLGSWLTAYYDSWVWSGLTIVLLILGLWAALEADSDRVAESRLKHGVLAGIIAAIVARLMGLVTMVWAYDAWSSATAQAYDSLSDTYRVVFNGNLLATIVLIIGCGMLGAFIAYSMPYFLTREEDM
jgi:MFS family permease